MVALGLGSFCLAYAVCIFIATFVEGYKLGTGFPLPNTFGYIIIAAAICFK